MKGKINWFNLKNYDRTKELNLSEWENELMQRVILHFYMFNDGTFFETQKINKKDLQQVSLKIETIKNFGLFCNAPNQELNFEKKIYSLDKNKNKNILSDLSVFEAFSFYSPKRESVEFRKNLELLKNNMTLSYRDEELEKLYEEYQVPVSAHINKEYDHGDRYLKLNLNLSDDALKKQFETWLKCSREQFPFPEDEMNKTAFKDWSGWRVLEYWDIYTISKYEKLKISNKVIQSAIFPNNKTDGIGENVRKTVRKKALKVVSLETIKILNAQMSSS